MKIILWPAHYFPNIGGLEIITRTLALHLKKLGHHIIIISNNANATEFKKTVIDDIETYLFPFTATLFNHDVSRLKKIITQISELLNIFKPDIVNLHGWYETLAFYQVRILENKKIPFCITIHGLLEQAHYNTISCKQLWNAASAVNVVSNALLATLQHANFNHKSLRVIHNGLPIPKNKTVSSIVKNPVLLMIGRLSVEKCFDIAFYALKKVIIHHPNAKLILIGDGDQFTYLDQLKKKLHLEQHVEMIGFIRPDQVGDYIDRSTMILVPSRYESFSLVALEAALHAKPVVATHVFGLKEVVENNKTGILVNPENSDSLAVAVNYLLSHPKIIEKMGIAAQQRAESLFSIEKMTDHYLEMYFSVIKKYA